MIIKNRDIPFSWRINIYFDFNLKLKEGITMSEKYREFLKSSCWKTIDFSTTDQGRGLKSLPAEKPCHPEDRKIDLIKPGDWNSIHKVSIEAAIARRKSIRSYCEDAIKLEELSFLLHSLDQ